MPLGITMTCCAVAMKSGRSMARNGLSARRLFFISGASSRMISVSCAREACARSAESARRAGLAFDDRSRISWGSRLTSSAIEDSCAGDGAPFRMSERKPLYLVRECLGSNINIGDKAKKRSDLQTQKVDPFEC